jgi:hypothetical protein
MRSEIGMVMMLGSAIISVYPSGLALDAADMPMAPPAPPLLSMITF